MPLIFFPAKLITSCKNPRGQIVEQYTLPNRTVRIRIIMNPAAEKVSNTKVFKIEGTNWRYSVPLVIEVGISPVKSIITIVVGIKKIRDNTILIILSDEDFIKLEYNSINLQRT